MVITVSSAVKRRRYNYEDREGAKHWINSPYVPPTPHYQHILPISGSWKTMLPTILVNVFCLIPYPS